MTAFILCIAQMILIGVGSIYAAVSFPIVLLLLYFIQKIYLRTSRQLRLMDLEAKAPLYTLFEESLRGLVTIRAFGWERDLEEKNRVLLDRSQRPFYLLFAVQRWLTLVLDLLIAAVAVLLIVLVVQLRGTVTAGGIGLALIGVIQFSQYVKLLVTFWTTLETHIGSVARVRSFTETTPREEEEEEEDGKKQVVQVPTGWPREGGIEFCGITAAYGYVFFFFLFLFFISFSLSLFLSPFLYFFLPFFLFFFFFRFFSSFLSFFFFSFSFFSLSRLNVQY